MFPAAYLGFAQAVSHGGVSPWSVLLFPALVAAILLAVNLRERFIRLSAS
jgi:hypothetical protein